MEEKQMNKAVSTIFFIVIQVTYEQECIKYICTAERIFFNEHPITTQDKEQNTASIPEAPCTIALHSEEIIIPTIGTTLMLFKIL